MFFHFSCSVVSHSLWHHEPQHARPPCPSPTPGVHPNPCPSSRWCHPTISSSVVLFSSWPQSFPASGSFQMSQLFASGGQSTGVSALTSVPPMTTQDLSPQGTLKNLLQHHCSKVSIFQCSAFFMVQLSHPYMTTGKQCDQSEDADLAQVKMERCWQGLFCCSFLINIYSCTTQPTASPSTHGGRG